MLKSLILLVLVLKGVICGNNFCKNGAILDSIVFVKSQNMFFFTSGGHYWYVKKNQFPPKGMGTPLPEGFKRGEAAFFIDYLNNCKGTKRPDGQQLDSQEIHILENIDGETKVMIYDVRNPTDPWSKEPIPHYMVKGLSQAKIDFSKTIDATFVHQGLYLIIIQDTIYAIVDLKDVCTDPNAFGRGTKSREFSELDVESIVDATTEWESPVKFLLFQSQSYWEVVIQNEYWTEGRIHTMKGTQKESVRSFFNYSENCKIPRNKASTKRPEFGVGPVGEINQETDSDNEDTTESEEPEHETNPEEESGDADSSPSGEESGGFLWIIIIVIIVVIVILIAIVLIACLAMSNKGDNDGEAGAAGAADPGLEEGAAGAKSSLGTSPSTMSVRSNTGLGGGPSGSPGGTAGGASGPNSSMGTSPSTISVRSTTGGGPPGSTSKTETQSPTGGNATSNLGTSPSTMSVRSTAGVSPTSKTGSKK